MTSPTIWGAKAPYDEPALGNRMRPERLSGFSDGVIAIIITIMVLELKVPHGGDWEALKSSLPVFLSYVLSFLYVAIYWNNHHHLLHTCRRVNGAILWANTHLLFWLSLIPFATAFSGSAHREGHCGTLNRCAPRSRRPLSGAARSVPPGHTMQ